MRAGELLASRHDHNHTPLTACDMADVYKIEVNDRGGFTAFEHDDGRWELDRPGRRERFKLSSDGGTFSIIERDDGITTKDVYTDSNRDGIFEFQRTSALGRKSGSREDSYKVDIVTGGKLRVFEWEDGRWRLERSNRNERFSLTSNAKILTRFETEEEGTEINIYRDRDGDGVFKFASSRFESSGIASSPLTSAFEIQPDAFMVVPDPLF